MSAAQEINGGPNKPPMKGFLMRASRAALVATVAAVAGLSFASPVNAEVVSTPLEYSPKAGAPGSFTVDINRGGFAPGQVVFVQQCRRTEVPAAPAFDPEADCSQATGLNPSANASGSVVQTFTLFQGDEPNLGEWACATPASCFVRLAPDTKSNIGADVFFALTPASLPEPVIPESPFAILLPVGAMGLLIGGFAVARKRRAASIA